MNVNEKHGHAGKGMIYAVDMLETSEPWLRWEHTVPCADGDRWETCKENTVMWLPHIEYRRIHQPQKYVLELPEPLREAPTAGALIYRVTLMEVLEDMWFGQHHQMELLKNGLLFRSKEDGQLFIKAITSRKPATD